MTSVRNLWLQPTKAQYDTFYERCLEGFSDGPLGSRVEKWDDRFVDYYNKTCQGVIETIAAYKVKANLGKNFRL